MSAVGRLERAYTRRKIILIQDNIRSIHRGGTFMTILSQRGVIRLLALSSLLILPATTGAQQRAPIVEKLAKTYGLDSFGQIEAIRYTF